MSQTVDTVWEGTIDWITATAREPRQVSALVCLGESLVDLQVSADYKRKPWSRWGFTGESSRCVSFGRRGDESVLVLSSYLADCNFPIVLGRADHISRLDLAVTVRTVPHQEGVARKHYADFVKAGAGGRKGAVASLIQSTDGGSTTYLGRRISDKWLRIYDKWRESKDDAYKGCWRYELETKNAVAMGLARQLADGPTRPGRIAATVYQHCFTRGTQPIYSPNAEPVYLFSPRPSTDLERQCEWLATNVAGTAQIVASAIGPDKLLTILGVDFIARNGRIDQAGGDHGHHAYEVGDKPLDLDHEEGDIL